METEFYDNTSAAPGLNLNFASESFLRTTAKWGKFLAIVGFVSVAIMVLGGLFLGSAAVTSNALADKPSLLGIGGGYFVMINLMAILYVLPILYLYRFSARMNRALDLKDETLIAESLGSLKSLFKFIGIFTIVIVGFYVIIAVMMIIFGAGMSALT